MRAYDDLISRERPEPGEWHIALRGEPRRDCVRCHWPVTNEFPHAWCWAVAEAATVKPEQEAA